MLKLVGNLKLDRGNMPGAVRASAGCVNAPALMALFLFLLTQTGALAAAPSMTARLDREIALISEALPEMRVRLEAEQRQRTAGFGVLN